MAETDPGRTTERVKLNSGAINALMIYMSSRTGVEALVKAAIESTPDSAHRALQKARSQAVGYIAERAIEPAQHVCNVEGVGITHTLQQDLAIDFSCNKPPETCCQRGLAAATAIVRYEEGKAVLAATTDSLKIFKD